MYMIGTSYFVSFANAVRYYREYGLTAKDVADKEANGEIHFGKPETKPNEQIFVREGRYHIQVGY